MQCLKNKTNFECLEKLPQTRHEKQQELHRRSGLCRNRMQERRRNRIYEPEVQKNLPQARNAGHYRKERAGLPSRACQDPAGRPSGPPEKQRLHHREKRSEEAHLPDSVVRQGRIRRLYGAIDGDSI